MRKANVNVENVNVENGWNISDELILYYNNKLSLNDDYINNNNIVNNMNQFLKFYKSKNKNIKIELYETPNFEKIKYIIDNKSKFKNCKNMGEIIQVVFDFVVRNYESVNTYIIR